MFNIFPNYTSQQLISDSQYASYRQITCYRIQYYTYIRGAAHGEAFQVRNYVDYLPIDSSLLLSHLQILAL